MLSMLPPSWHNPLTKRLSPAYLQDLELKVATAYQTETVYPREEHLFTALVTTPLEQVRVVILGQDPYHGEGQAHGLAFSVQDDIPLPPSLKNIYKEITTETSSTPPESGNLTRLATQGVLLLNTTLTVRAGEAGSHSTLGWSPFTDAIIATVSETREHVVFMLWGSHAQSKLSLIDQSRHLVLEAPHPSPLSAYRGFFGCQHFTKANAYLKAHGQPPITW